MSGLEGRMDGMKSELASVGVAASGAAHAAASAMTAANSAAAAVASSSSSTTARILTPPSPRSLSADSDTERRKRKSGGKRGKKSRESSRSMSGERKQHVNGVASGKEGNGTHNHHIPMTPASLFSSSSSSSSMGPSSSAPPNGSAFSTMTSYHSVASEFSGVGGSGSVSSRKGKEVAHQQRELDERGGGKALPPAPYVSMLGLSVVCVAVAASYWMTHGVPKGGGIL